MAYQLASDIGTNINPKHIAYKLANAIGGEAIAPKYKTVGHAIVGRTLFGICDLNAFGYDGFDATVIEIPEGEDLPTSYSEAQDWIEGVGNVPYKTCATVKEAVECLQAFLLRTM